MKHLFSVILVIIKRFNFDNVSFSIFNFAINYLNILKILITIFKKEKISKMNQKWVNISHEEKINF